MFQVNKSNTSTDFWSNLKLTWQKCANVPNKRWANCVAELDGKIYITGQGSGVMGTNPYMYDSVKDQWSVMPPLPYVLYTLVTVRNKKQLLAVGGIIKKNNIVEMNRRVFLWDEKNNKWIAPYPYMPTARHRCSCVSYGSSVIVAGGVTSSNPVTVLRSVEVLHINDSHLPSSHWSVVEQLPHAMFQAVPLIVNDKLYIAVGYDEGRGSTCNVVFASLPQLLQSTNNSSHVQVWKKLPDMPYSSLSINHYKGHLIAFTGDHLAEQVDGGKPVWKLVPLVHIYNPVTKSWDCVGRMSHGYLFGLSVHINENKILFVGGLTGTHEPSKDDDLLTTCMMLTFQPK